MMFETGRTQTIRRMLGLGFSAMILLLVMAGIVGWDRLLTCRRKWKRHSVTRTK